MDISIYGAGYVGLVSAVCFAKLGHRVICADIDKEKVARLSSGECPIYEKQLPELLKETLENGNIQFTDDLFTAINKSSVHFIATGTPGTSDGSADLSQVYDVATLLVQEMKQDALLVIKSTVPIGTCKELECYLRDKLLHSKKDYKIEVASNPEFLREGNAIEDFMEADRIVLGGSDASVETLKTIYKPLMEQGIPIISMSLESSELTKYAANTMLACKVSFINQISQISEKTGANIDDIQKGVGLDKRIGPHFLNAGIGYGGSCFPKDCRALTHFARSAGVDCALLDSIESINLSQKSWVIKKLKSHFKEQLVNLTVGIWGLSFKPNTNDMREASSLQIINDLLSSGVQLCLYDPEAMPEAKSFFPKETHITWCDSLEQVLEKDIEALVIATEWDDFKQYPIEKLANQLGGSPIFDGRNCFDLSEVKAANVSYYYSVGRPCISSS